MKAAKKQEEFNAVAAAKAKTDGEAADAETAATVLENGILWKCGHWAGNCELRV